MNHRLVSLIVVVGAVFLAFFVYPQAWDRLAGIVGGPHFFKAPPFRLGLDLLGGTHLVYQADLAKLEGQSPSDAMAGVRDVIERRVNLFGVAEPLVQIEGRDRLVVELAGVKDVNQAIELIGLTPFLEFREESPASPNGTVPKAERPRAEVELAFGTKGRKDRRDELPEDKFNIGSGTGNIGTGTFKPTGLTGKHLKRSQVIFDPNTYQPEVALQLDDEGTKLFAGITKKNLGKVVAIYLDGQPISAPVVQSEIPNGQAIITGNFDIKEAKDLVNRLNAGALPVPVTLVSQQTIGASLGQDSLQKSLRAGLYGLLSVSIFMILYYRLPGLVAVFALMVYVAIVLTIYKLFPVTLTLAGIAGFILSLGMAVDANILIFARMREELKLGKPLGQALREGFRRAWLSIRDSHVTTLLGSMVLYIFTTSFVKGFALTLGIGVLTSLFTAIVVTRSFLDVFVGQWFEKRKWLF